MDNQIAKELMRSHCIEQDISVTRNYVEILGHLGLLSDEIVTGTVPETSKQSSQALNMTNGLKPEPTAYFVKRLDEY